MHPSSLFITDEQFIQILRAAVDPSDSPMHPEDIAYKYEIVTKALGLGLSEFIRIITSD